MSGAAKLEPGFPLVSVFEVWGFLINLILQFFLLCCTAAEGEEALPPCAPRQGRMQ